MFHRVFVEEDIAEHRQTKKILAQLNPKKVELIENYNNIWGQVKKPYLQKRQELNLFIAKKRGQLIKLAPDAYGAKGGPHYYFIHAFNCIYECEYCYLQGYFHTPDLVFFINHDDILAEMENILEHHQEASQVWFHGGEFSDSLALSHLTQELDTYFKFFYRHPRAHLELRTKSANIRVLKSLAPSSNIIVSYSLSPSQHLNEMDRKTPGLKARLRAIKELSKCHYRIGIHLDPIIDSPCLEQQYGELLSDLEEALSWEQLAYVSLGVVRFTSSVYRQVEKNYPHSSIRQQEFVKSFDNKIRYSRAHRTKILGNIKNLCLQWKIPEKKIYLCMEN